MIDIRIRHLTDDIRETASHIEYCRERRMFKALEALHRHYYTTEQELRELLNPR